MSNRKHIVVIEPSIIVRGGVIALLANLRGLDIDIAGCSHIDDIASLHLNHEPDVVIINPSLVGAMPLNKLGVGGGDTLFVALQNNLSDTSLLSSYNSVISIYDSANDINDKITTLLENPKESTERVELSIREQEIVACIAKGFSNKQIAEELFLSTHTVMTHRRNITTKLQIHSSAGLTIYAIVNKLVNINELK